MALYIGKSTNLVALIGFFLLVIVLVVSCEEQNGPGNDPLPQQVADLVIGRQKRFHVVVLLCNVQLLESLDTVLLLLKLLFNKQVSKYI